MPAACQTARTNLDASLLARFNSVGPTGLLVTEQNALNANPDLPSFPSMPLAAVLAEQARIFAFQTALAGIPVTDPPPPALLTSNQAFALARQSFISTVRIPEMDGFLLTTPGYYNTRFQLLRLRVAGNGTVHKVNFFQSAIAAAPAERADLLAQRALLESLLP